MNKKNILLLAIVLFGAGVTFAAEQPVTAKTKCYKGIVEMPCPQPEDDSSGNDAQDFKPLLPSTDLGNGVIQDNFTGLMWQKVTAPGVGSGEYPDRYTWDQANAYCADLSLGGHTDWRLPDVIELQSLVDYSRYNPSINITYFPKTRASRYWSSTMFANDAKGAWYVSFFYGYARNCIKTSHYYVRAVRSGQ